MARRNTILVVDDSRLNRMTLNRILSVQYQVLEAEDGREGLNMLAQHLDEIAAIILDLKLPVMDGFEFMEECGNHQEFRNIPIVIATGDLELETEQRCLSMGAWDMLRKPYHPSILRLRLRNVIEKSWMTETERDEVTGILNRTSFLFQTRQLLSLNVDEQFVFIRVDISNFKMINNSFGMGEGNRLLKHIAHGLDLLLGDDERTEYARMEADVFCICMPYRKNLVEEKMNRLVNHIQGYTSTYYLQPAIGVYVIEDNTADISMMYDLASMAAQQCKGHYGTHISYYSEEISAGLVKEQAIINEMERALENKEFVVYLQPKYRVSDGEPFGAEALVRWKHPMKGMVPPGDFIPVFEKNGFIGKLDYYMWEEVCILIRKWMSQGNTVTPVSVNVSRVNVYNPNLVNEIVGLVKKYDVPPEYLQLELTESVFIDNQDLLKKALKELREAGFSILMDDFGSGFSSLNILKDIDMDILKLDMKFLPLEESDEKAEKIITSVIKMAKLLNYPVIAEGVETARQVEFLKKAGCDYIQGYYFAKPMPVDEYEMLLESGAPAILKSVSGEQNAEDGGTKRPEVMDLSFQYSNDLLLFDSFMFPLAILECSENSVDIVRSNHEFRRMYAAYFTDSNGESLDFAELVPGSMEKIREIITYASKGNMTWIIDDRAQYRISGQLLSKAEDTALLMCAFVEEKTAD